MVGAYDPARPASVERVGQAPAEPGTSAKTIGRGPTLSEFVPTASVGVKGLSAVVDARVVSFDCYTYTCEAEIGPLKLTIEVPEDAVERYDEANGVYIYPDDCEVIRVTLL